MTREQDHLDLARRCVRAMVDSASGIADYGVDELASQSLGRMRTERLRALSASLVLILRRTARAPG